MFKVLGLEQWFPESVPPASIISTVWKLDKNRYSCASSQPIESELIEMGTVNLCFTSLLRDSVICSSVETTGLED